MKKQTFVLQKVVWITQNREEKKKKSEKFIRRACTRFRCKLFSPSSIFIFLLTPEHRDKFTFHTGTKNFSSSLFVSKITANL